MIIVTTILCYNVNEIENYVIHLKMYSNYDVFN